MIFYLGTHEVNWLGRLGVPLFVSRRRLAMRKKLPIASAPWALDSGGFTELNLFGHWQTTEDQYVADVELYEREIGKLEANEQLDEYIDSDGETPLVTVPPSKRGEFGGATYVDVPPWPNDRPRYGIDYLVPQTRGISSVGDLPDPEPRKKPAREVPVLDDEYFAAKEQERLVEHELRFGRYMPMQSASYSPFVPSSVFAAAVFPYGASYHGYATGAALLNEAERCLRYRDGHTFDRGHCIYCYTRER